MDKVRDKGTHRQKHPKDERETRRWGKAQAEKSVGQRQSSRLKARVTDNNNLSSGSLGPPAVK